LSKYGAVNHLDQENLPPASPNQPPLPVNWLPQHPFDHGHTTVRDEVGVKGVWKNGKLHGQGVWETYQTDPQDIELIEGGERAMFGSIIKFDGEYKNGKQHEGTAKFFHDDSLLVEGIEDDWGFAHRVRFENIVLDEYSSLISKLDSKGIQFYDAKNEMKDFPDHYKKLEELMWNFFQDMPMPEGIAHTRIPFDQFMKYQNRFEEKLYGIEIVAVDGEKYIGSTDIYVMPKSDPYTAWTGSLGVRREYRRQGIATALKVKAFEKLRAKGIKQVRTDNEENNPMYLINVTLGFTPEPYCLEYQKEI